MSHRITVKAKIDDKEAVKRALKDCKFSFSGDSLFRVTSGPLTGVLIDTKRGTLTGDSDHNKQEDLNQFRQQYGVAKAKINIEQQGHILQREETLEDGSVALYCMWA